MNKCIDKCIELVDKTYHLCIEKTILYFEVDMGYVNGNMSYAPLSEKPMIDYNVLKAGNNTYKELGLQEEIIDITDQDIDNIIYGG